MYSLVVLSQDNKMPLRKETLTYESEMSFDKTRTVLKKPQSAKRIPKNIDYNPLVYYSPCQNSF